MIPRWRATVLLIVVFLAGVGVGVVGWRLLGPPRRGGRPSPDRAVEMLDRRLHLRAGQRDSVRAVLERHRPELDSVWAAFRPRFDSLQRVIGKEIEAQLDPDQRTKFAELRRQFEQRQHERQAAPAVP
jgi:heavy-metal resistance protein